MKRVLVLGRFKTCPALTVELVKNRGHYDVMIMGGPRPTPLWRFVERDTNEIIDHLARRDAARFSAAGGVDWYRRER